MTTSQLTGIPDGLRRILAAGESDDVLKAVARFLKATRSHILLAWFSEQVLRRNDDLVWWQFHAQALTELGFLSAASEVLDGLRRRIEAAPDALAVDLLALEGRIAKQRLIEAPPLDKRRPRYLRNASKCYNAALKRAGDDAGLRYFPGINIVSLIALASRSGSRLPGPTVEEVARAVSADLDATAAAESNYHWWQATRAECALALGDHETFRSSLRTLLDLRKSNNEMAKATDVRRRFLDKGYFESLPEVDPFAADAFVLASFHRQLQEIWRVDELGAPAVNDGLIQLRAAVLRRRGGSLEFDSATLKLFRSNLLTISEQAMLGQEEASDFEWVRTCIRRAASVAAILVKAPGGGRIRIGTGFAVALKGRPDLCLMTNDHVLPDPEFARTCSARFEAADAAVAPAVQVGDRLWHSVGHDAALYALSALPEIVEPLRLRAPLPSFPRDGPAPRVYVIGYPKGDAMHVTFRDNELLDYEPALANAPATPRRVDYRAPTDNGNSGSPVFEETRWALVALHNGTISLGEGLVWNLSGRPGYSRANKGISIASIASALEAAGLPLA